MNVVRFALHRLNVLSKRPIFLSLFILVPMVLAFFLGFFLLKSAEEVRIPIAVVDEDQSSYSMFVLQELEQEPVIRVIDTDRGQAEVLLRRNKVDSVFIFHSGFEQGIRQGEDSLITLLKTPSSLAAGLIQEVVAGKVIRLAGNANAANYVVEKYKALGLPQDDELWEAAWETSDTHWEPTPLMTIQYSELNKSVFLGFSATPKKNEKAYLLGMQGILVIFLFMSFISAQWLFEDKRNGVLQRIEIANGNLVRYIFGNSLPFLMIWLLEVGLLYIWSIYTLQVQSLSRLSMEGLLGTYLVFSWLLGIASACFYRSRESFQLGALFFTLISILVSGGISGNEGLVIGILGGGSLLLLGIIFYGIHSKALLKV